MNQHHKEILDSIKSRSGKATQHTFLDSYLGNSHPRYAINAPALRKIAKEWMRVHCDLSADQFRKLLTSLVEGESSTEKVMAGILLDNATADQRKFDPKIFNQWLDHLIGWVEIDSVCTGHYTIAEIPSNIKVWKKLLTDFLKSPNINKRRASLVFLCSPMRHSDDFALAKLALQNINRLKKEKEIIITRAISWLLRSMVKLHRKTLTDYLKKNEKSLPAIAVRETKTVLRTGKKTRGKDI